MRQRMGLTQKEFSEKIGATKQTISHWENDRGAAKNEYLPKLAEFTGYSVDFIASLKFKNQDAVFDGSELRHAPTEGKLRPIPVVSWARCGQAEFAASNYGDLEGQIDEFHWTLIKDPEAVALILEGDSMSPEYQPGDRIVISKQAEARPGDVVVARLRNSGETLFKRFRLSGKNGEEVVLESVNPLYEPLTFRREEFRFIYPVVDMRRNPRR